VFDANCGAFQARRAMLQVFARLCGEEDAVG
jgi:hypothetical protein